MDWSSGYSVSYHVGIIDTMTWRDIDRFEITSGSISRTNTDLRNAADIDCIGYDQNRERWVRIWLDARQQGSADVHIPLFTGIASSPSKTIDGNIVSTPVQCYSVLKPAEDILLPRGWYAPVNIQGAKLIENLLMVTQAPTVIDPDSSGLKTAIIAENGETNLSMVEKILQVINWRMFITGDGTIHVAPKAKDVTSRFSAMENDILEPSIDISYDWFSCPNVLRATSGDTTATARDDNPNSMLSTVSRGREIWAEESSPDYTENETLSGFASRRLKELQKVATTVSYTRRFDPNLMPTDLVDINYPKQNLIGRFIIKSQTIQLAQGTKVAEEVELVT